MGHRGVVGDQQVHAEQQRSGLVKGGVSINTALGGKKRSARRELQICSAAGPPHRDRSQCCRAVIRSNSAKPKERPARRGLDRIAAGGALPVQGQQRSRARCLGQLLAPGRLPHRDSRHHCGAGPVTEEMGRLIRWVQASSGRPCGGLTSTASNSRAHASDPPGRDRRPGTGFEPAGGGTKRRLKSRSPKPPSAANNTSRPWPSCWGDSSARARPV